MSSWAGLSGGVHPPGSGAVLLGLGSLTIGIPGFLLALAPATRRARAGFVARVAAFALPAGSIAAAATLASYGLARQLIPADAAAARTAATLTLTAAGLSVLWLLLGPAAGARRRSTPPIVRLPGWTRLLPLAMLAAVAVILAVPVLRDFFALRPLPAVLWWLITGVAVVSHGLLLLSAGRRASR